MGFCGASQRRRVVVPELSAEQGGCGQGPCSRDPGSHGTGFPRPSTCCQWTTLLLRCLAGQFCPPGTLPAHLPCVLFNPGSSPGLPSLTLQSVKWPILVCWGRGASREIRRCCHLGPSGCRCWGGADADVSVPQQHWARVGCTPPLSSLQRGAAPSTDFAVPPAHAPDARMVMWPLGQEGRKVWGSGSRSSPARGQVGGPERAGCPDCVRG